MKAKLPPYVYQKPKGFYFQRRGWTTVRMQAEPGTAAFAIEYAAILNGAEIIPRASGRTFHALVDSYTASPRYAALAPRTARDYDKILKWVADKLGKLEVERMQRRDIIQARDANAAKVRFAKHGPKI